MSLDDLNLDSSEGASQSQEAPSEKQKESSRKAHAQLQKTQKDEKKAKSDNDELFHILSRFIKNPLYEELIPDVVLLLQYNYPSRFLLIIIALVYPEASFFLFDKSNIKNGKSLLLSLHSYDEIIEFHDDTIHQSLRDWITVWLTASEQFLTDESTSTILTQKLANLLSSNQSEIAKKSLASVFQFFFRQKNVTMSREKASAYGEFILIQLQSSLRETLEHMDTDLKEQKQVNERDLFGM